MIFTDYNDNFNLSVDKNMKYKSMNVEKVKEEFELKEFLVEVKKFSEFNPQHNYNGCYVLYQTSESKGQFYKRFIEDIMYFLEMSGAILLPGYKYLKAHHNKGFMELIRYSFKNSSLQSITSMYYGSASEALTHQTALPCVIKQVSGAGSEGVYCAESEGEYKRYVRRITKTIFANNYYDLAKTVIKSKIRCILNNLNVINSNFVSDKVEQPVVIQNLIKNLSGDYKVLYFGGKYYPIYRENRINDFRASGSGKLHKVETKEVVGLLNYAQVIVNEIDFPIIGMDIGFDGSTYHLIEFQMIHLGPFALQMSEGYFELESNQWIHKVEKSDLEREFVRSISQYIDNKYPNN
jgi:glutathione synthase/RimK-type ligase-like ATP-grasp enzyme